MSVELVELKEHECWLKVMESDTSMPEKKRRIVYRFNTNCDVVLLKLVLENNPWARGGSWGTLAPLVSRGCGKSFSARAVRDRTEFLISKYKSEELKYLKKSGTEEEYTEREALLKNVLSMKENCGVTSAKKVRIESGRNVQFPMFAAAEETPQSAFPTESLSPAPSPSEHLPPPEEALPRRSLLKRRRPNTLKKRGIGISGLVEKFKEKELELEKERLEIKRIECENDKNKILNETRRLELEEARIALEVKKFRSNEKLMQTIINKMDSREQMLLAVIKDVFNKKNCG